MLLIIYVNTEFFLIIETISKFTNYYNIGIFINNFISIINITLGIN